MKKLVIASMLLGTFLGGIAQEDPSKASYYIDGYYEIKDGRYILSDITSKGISFNLPNGNWNEGRDNNTDDQIIFTFPNAQTSYPKGFNEKFKFWIWQSEQKRWLREQEVTDGKVQHETNKFTCIMLLIDCSSSIGANFSTVKESAKNFVAQLYATPNHNNIHIGIIGFNTNSNNLGYSPQPLNAGNYQQITAFIDAMSLANGTAFYRAMDKAIDQIVIHIDEIEKNDPYFFSHTQFESSHIISFTDGIDNTSRLPNTQNLSANNSWENNPYYIHIVKKLNDTFVKGQRISSHLVVVNNDEIRGFENEFERLARGITSKNERGVYQYYLVNDFSDLSREFAKIINSLTVRWNDLYLFIPQNRVGRVRWTLGTEQEVKKAEKKVVHNNRPYRNSLGLIVGSLNGFSYKGFPGNNFALQADLAIRPFILEDYYTSAPQTTLTGILEADVNFLYEKSFKQTQSGGWYWFVGGGFGLGGTLVDEYFKIGLNAMGGIEYAFRKVPITLQVDLRPGYSFVIDYDNLFEFTATFSARWHF